MKLGLILGTVVAIILVDIAIVSCVKTASGPSTTDIAAFSASQIACVEDNDASATINACRAASRTSFCQQWPGYDTRCTNGGQ